MTTLIMPTSENAGLPLIFSSCKPKEDVRSGTMADADFAADLSGMLRLGIATRPSSSPTRIPREA